VKASLSGFRALESPRFRSYLLGQLTSLTGTWIQQVTIALLAFRMTGSSAAVAVALAFSQLPILVLSPLAGLVNDRFDRRRVLICTQLASLVQALLLTATYYTGTLHITVLFALSAFGGLISALDLPARQSILARLLDRPADIRNAVALSSASVHVARLIGPALAALLLEKWDAHVCFAANALSCAWFSVVLLNLGVTAHDPIRRISLTLLREGWQYCKAHADTRQTLAWIAVASLFAIPYTSLLPAAARLWAAGKSISYAELMTAAGGGGVFAALVLAHVQTDEILRRAIPLSLILAALGLIAVGVAGAGLPSSILLALVAALGFTLTVVVSGGNVLLQQNVPEAMRGRVLGLFVMLFNGVAPIGALAWGFVGDHLSLPISLTAAGAITVSIVVARCGVLIGRRYSPP
jgi:MFS family permease